MQEHKLDKRISYRNYLSAVTGWNFHVNTPFYNVKQPTQVSSFFNAIICDKLGKKAVLYCILLNIRKTW